MNTGVPKACKWSTLREADYHGANVHHELNADDRPQEAPAPFVRRDQSQQKDGERYTSKTRAHNGKDLAKIHPFDRVKNLLGREELNMAP